MDSIFLYGGNIPMQYQRLFKALDLYFRPLNFHSDSLSKSHSPNSLEEYCLITVAEILHLNAMLF